LFNKPSIISLDSFCLFIMVRVLILVALSALLSTVHSLENGLARKPQMGWNSWNHFGCGINEELIRSTAKTIVDTGLAAVGYEFVNLDDCWADHRDSETRVIPDAKGFPSGMFALGEYIHSLGLKYGIYSDSGNKTCAGRPGSLGYEVVDALTYAAWGIDYLKYDNCFDDGIDVKVRYPPMRDALNATGRPILFSMCEWGVEDPATWAPKVGNSWRTTGDINDHWASFTGNLDQNDKWWNLAGPGQWNDPDMLEVGNGGMTNDEYQAHFSLWSLIKSPLLIGCDVTKMSNETYTILTNTEIIALSQDDLGVQGHRVSDAGDQELWAGPLFNGDVALILFNRGNTSANMTVNWSQHLGMNADTTVAIRDLVQHKDLGKFASSYSAVIGPHASQTLRLSPTSAKKAGKVVNIYNQYARHPGMKKILHPSPPKASKKF